MNNQDFPNKLTTNEIHPSYYEGFDAIIQSKFSIEEQITISEFNIWKYLYRYKEKNGIEDLKKAITYIEYIIEKLEKLEETNKEKPDK